MRFWSKLLVFAVVFGVLGAAAGAAATTNPEITVTLHGTNALAGVACPHTEQFTASVHAPAGMVITYRFERSTANEATHTATISSKGAMQFSDSWTTSKSGSYWSQFHVLTPQSVESNKATFQVHCAGGM